jgi:hypothetical protein
VHVHFGGESEGYSHCTCREHKKKDDVSADFWVRVRRVLLHNSFGIRVSNLPSLYSSRSNGETMVVKRKGEAELWTSKRLKCMSTH